MCIRDRAFSLYSREEERELFAPWFETFAPKGRAPLAGELVYLPDHAASLRELARTDCESFYLSLIHIWKNIELSAKEFAVLEFMIRNKGSVLSREAIENNVWSYDWEGGTNVVDVYMSYLRRKLDADFEKKLIHTVRGVGWVLRDEA